MIASVRVALISWSRDAADAVERLRTLAEEVEIETDAAAIAADPPDAIVVDLDERPAEALAIAVELADVPHVFLGGDAGSVGRVRGALPDARFSDLDGITTQLRTALERPPTEEQGRG